MHKHRQFGMTVIEVAIALVIGVMLSLAALSLTMKEKGSIAGFDFLGELADLARYVRAMTGCTQTFTAAVRTTCTGATAASNRYILVKNVDGADLLPVDQSGMIGMYNVRAKCVDEAGFFSIVFEYRKMAGGQEMLNPITKQMDGWKPVAMGIPLACL